MTAKLLQMEVRLVSSWMCFSAWKKGWQELFGGRLGLSDMSATAVMLNIIFFST